MSLDEPSSHLQKLVIAAALLVLGYLYYWLLDKRRDRAWRDFAARHDWGFTYSGGAWEIQGIHQGRQFSVRTKYRRSGKSWHLFTVVQLELGQVLPPDLKIRPERLGDKLLKVLGRRDEEVGDAELDAALDVGNLSAESRDVLRTPQVRLQLRLLKQRTPSFSLEDGQLQVEAKGMPDNVAALESLVVPALRLSDALHEVTEQGHVLKSG